MGLLGLTCWWVNASEMRRIERAASTDNISYDWDTKVWSIVKWIAEWEVSCSSFCTLGVMIVMMTLLRRMIAHQLCNTQDTGKTFHKRRHCCIVICHHIFMPNTKLSDQLKCMTSNIYWSWRLQFRWHFLFAKGGRKAFKFVKYLSAVTAPSPFVMLSELCQNLHKLISNSTVNTLTHSGHHTEYLRNPWKSECKLNVIVMLSS